MTFDLFIGKWNDRGIDFDGAYGDQCMDLMHQYCVEVLGIPDGRVLAAPAAKDVYLNFDKMVGREKFEKIANTPTGVPQKGDIILWGTGIGPYGHVAIFLDGDATKFRSFDQNFPTGSKCHLQTHDYKGVLGWLRFKGEIVEDGIFVEKSVFEHLVGKATKYDEFLASGYSEVASITKTLDEYRAARDNNWNLYQEQVEILSEKVSRIQLLEEEIQNLTKERDEYINANKTLNDKLSDLASAIKKDAVEDADVHIKLLDAEHEKANLAKEAQEFFTALINLFLRKKGR